MHNNFWSILFNLCTYRCNCPSRDNDGRILPHIYHRLNNALIWLDDESGKCYKTDSRSRSASLLNLWLSESESKRKSNNTKMMGRNERCMYDWPNVYIYCFSSVIELNLRFKWFHINIISFLLQDYMSLFYYISTCIFIWKTDLYTCICTCIYK